MSSKALQLYWSHFQSFTKDNWKYAVVFGIGSLFSSLCSLLFVKKITGWSNLELIFKLMIARESTKYRNTIKYEGFSVYPSAMRPSTECMAMDSFFRKQQAKPTEKDVKTFRETYMKTRKQIDANRSPRYTLPPYVETPKEVIIRDSSANNQGPLKGYLLTYPGATMDGVILYLHGGAFQLGFVIYALFY